MRINTKPDHNDTKTPPKSQPDPAVLLAHMVVDALALVERRETDPADVRLAPRARHVVAPLVALDRHLAARAPLHVVLVRPLREQLLLGRVPLRARHPVVRLNMARRADAREAGRAL